MNILLLTVLFFGTGNPLVLKAYQLFFRYLLHHQLIGMVCGPGGQALGLFKDFDIVLAMSTRMIFQVKFPIRNTINTYTNNSTPWASVGVILNGCSVKVQLRRAIRITFSKGGTGGIPILVMCFKAFVIPSGVIVFNCLPGRL